MIQSPLILNTPLEDHLEEFGLLVKREDLSCPPPGPPFSKTRGVFAHMARKVEEGVTLFGALDTFHSQAGHAVAHAAKLLGVGCVNYFPVYKADTKPYYSGSWPEDVPFPFYSVRHQRVVELRPPQQRSSELGAELVGLPAGRSAVLYHSARRDCEARGGYMMPNALKLPETVTETAAEVRRTFEQGLSREHRKTMEDYPWLVACSSATIAAGVLKGLIGEVPQPRVILHMGYSRSREAVFRYVSQVAGIDPGAIGQLCSFVDEGYAYKDTAPDDVLAPPWPCSPWYDRKAYYWWAREGRERFGRAVLWNVG